MTNHFGDVVANSKLIMMVGANSAVANPIGFKHFLQAKDRGAKLIVVDPIFTRSAAKVAISEDLDTKDRNTWTLW
jgi:formate dehydrogenase major subunit